jgi:hypothetical protein
VWKKIPIFGFFLEEGAFAESIRTLGHVWGKTFYPGGEQHYMFIFKEK